MRAADFRDKGESMANGGLANAGLTGPGLAGTGKAVPGQLAPGKPGRAKIGAALGAPARQRGVVLLITLIALVAMMLAGIGMMRSIDTSTMVAGNVAFRQATLNAGEYGLNVASAMLVQIASNANDKVVLNYDDGATPSIPPAPGLAPVNVCPGALTASLCNGNAIKLPGYKSTPFKACEIYPPAWPPSAPNPGQCPSPADYQWWMVSANWTNAPGPLAINDASGNKIADVYYLIQRMCNTPDLAANGAMQSCQTMQQTQTSTSSHSVASSQFTQTLVYYRITAKAVGPRNTITYSQGLVLIPE